MDDLSDVGKKIFGSDSLAYNTAGYATIGGMFVIACGSEFGNVGDEIEFTLDDGQTFKCIIGQINEDSDGGIQFFVNDSWSADGAENFQPEIVDHISKIQNLGSNREYASGAKIDGALYWAVDTATSTETDPTKFDSSSFVISAFESVGIPLTDAGATSLATMKDAFVKSGFEWTPGNPSLDDLKPGDVLLSHGTTVIYCGDGKVIGADGTKISVTELSSDSSWDGVLRYAGTNVAPAAEGTVTIPTAPHITVTTTTPETTPATTVSTDPVTIPQTIPTTVPASQPQTVPPTTASTQPTVEV